MKKVKMILPLFAFVFALAAAFVSSIKTVQADDLTIAGRWLETCEVKQVDCGSGNFTCMVGSEVIYEDNQAQECETPLKQISPN